LKDDEEFWDILTLDNWIIFQSLHRFIFLDKTTNEVQYLKINGTIQFSIVLDNQIYFSSESGFFKLVNGQPELLIKNNLLSSNIINVFNYNDSLLLLSSRDGFLYTRRWWFCQKEKIISRF
jgi:hypothetical protein